VDGEVAPVARPATRSGRLVLGHTDVLVADSIGWDVATWSRSLRFWMASTRLPHGVRALEVGAGGDNAGISLWLAAHGFEVTCSGLEQPSSTMRSLHEQHGVASRITYARADVLALPFVEAFDLVVFKSVLGRVGGGDRFDRQLRAVAGMHAALRHGGELWFAENAAATGVHRAARQRFGAGRWAWRYVDLAEIPQLMGPFDSHETTTFGLTSAFGRNEAQRRALAALDRTVLDHVTRERWRYVVAGVARKG
jgi:SAM-dependent methyltransferase